MSSTPSARSTFIYGIIALALIASLLLLGIITAPAQNTQPPKPLDRESFVIGVRCTIESMKIRYNGPAKLDPTVSEQSFINSAVESAGNIAVSNGFKFTPADTTAKKK